MRENSYLVGCALCCLMCFCLIPGLAEETLAFAQPLMPASEMQRVTLNMTDGKALFARGEYPQAVDKLRAVLSEPDIPPGVAAEANLFLGHIARLEGDLSGARSFFSAITNLVEAPVVFRAEARFYIGYIYMREGDANAAPELRKVLEINRAPGEIIARTLFYLGRIAFDEHDNSAAEKYWQSALMVREIRPEDEAAARLWLGRLAYRMGRYRTAREFYALVSGMLLNSPESVAAAHSAALWEKAAAWEAEERIIEAGVDWRELAEMPLAPMHLRLAAQSELDRMGGVERPEFSDNGLELDFSVWARAFAGQAERVCLAECPLFVMFAERIAARPGERWQELFLDLREASDVAGNLKVVASLFDARTDRRLAEVSTPMGSRWGWLRADLRRHQATRARLRVELRAGRKTLGAVETFLDAASGSDPMQSPSLPRYIAEQARVPVVLDTPGGISTPRVWPVSFGVPFAAGSLWDLNALRLVDDSGKEIPSQKEVAGRWSDDGAIQWVRFDALATPADGCNLEFAQSRAVPGLPLRVSEKKGRITVDTGVARYVLASGRSPVREIAIGRKRLAFCGAQSRGLFVVDQAGRLGQAAEDNSVRIESRGPVSACIRFEGFYRDAEGVPMARHITRLEFFAGQAWTRIEHTLVLSEDTRKIRFKEIGWELDTTVADAASRRRPVRASFGAERTAPETVITAYLSEPMASAYMLQDRHYRFYAGTNHFRICVTDDGVNYSAIHEGGEMGDWAMLDGAGGGLMMACRESARQHPKEFEVRPDRITLRLFSSRDGEELDFRAPALVRKWNLEEWYPKGTRDSYRKTFERDPVEAIAEIDSNAAGWAKTHTILIAPMQPAEEKAMPEDAARLAHLLAFPVYAQIDPWWIYQSRTMGAIYPCSPDKFPEAEQMIEALWRSRLPGGHEPGDRYGFADYYHGPGYRLSIAPHCYGLAYTLRHDIWLTCARTWNRKLREFTENTTAAYLDNYLCHWPAPRKIAGLYTAGYSAPFDTGTADLPFFWGNRTTFTKSSSTDLHQFQWLYQLAGRRRGADAVRNFGEGLKTAWRLASGTPEIVGDRRNISAGRILMGLKVLTQAYAFDWDPELRFLANDVGWKIYDEDAEIGITKRHLRPEFIGSYYKVNEDAGALLDAWEVFGAPRYHKMVRRVGSYLWSTGTGVFPISRKQGPLGRLGVFLYDETDNPAVATALDFQMRWACTYYDRDTGQPKPIETSAVTFVLQDMPMIMDVLERFKASGQPPPAWLALDDYDQPFKIIVRKPHGRSVDINLQSSARGKLTGGNLTVEPLVDDRLGYFQVSVTELNMGLDRLHLPLEAPGIDYMISFRQSGFHLAFADQSLPMVIYAPGCWRLPDLRPAPPIYFQLPQSAVPDGKPRIMLEGGGRFFDPQGKPFRDGALLRGWVDLPGDQPGLWRFEPDNNQLVRTENIPPFFAMSRPEFYFEPNIDWADAGAEKKSMPGKAPAADVVSD